MRAATRSAASAIVARPDGPCPAARITSQDASPDSGGSNAGAAAPDSNYSDRRNTEMSHGITGTDSMFSVNSRRQPPWHGLGVVLDEYPKSIDEALEKAGLGWKVSHGDVLVVKHPE